VARHGEPTVPGDLRHARGLLFGGPDARQWVLYRGEERATVRPDHMVVANTGGFLEALARQGAGPVLVPEWLAGDRLASGELQRLLPDWEGASLTLWVVWPNHDFQSAATRSFVSWILEQSAGIALRGR